MPQTFDRPETFQWHSETLRLTCFQSPSVSIHDQHWWSEVVGDLPETHVVQLKRGLIRDEGTFEDGNLILQVLPTRIDWNLTKPPTSDSFAFNYATAQRFNKAMGRWFSISPPLVRIAFGAVLTSTVSSREEGYKQIGRFLPNVRLDPLGSSDFLYQINRPRNISIGKLELKVNRLSKWSVAMREVRELYDSSEQFAVSSREHFCALELDISTPHDMKSDLPKEQLNEILNVLIDLGREITMEGDIP